MPQHDIVAIRVPLACGEELAFVVGDLRPLLQDEAHASMSAHLDGCVVCTATAIVAVGI